MAEMRHITPYIILQDRIFETYAAYNVNGCRIVANTDFQSLKRHLDVNHFTEVYVNSKLGRQILAKIGAVR